MILRLVAVTITLAGVSDPVLSIGRPVRQPLAVTILETPSLSLPDGGATRRERAHQSALTLAAALSDDYAVTVLAQPVNSTADPCPSRSACVIVSDGARPRTMGARPGFLGGVSVGRPLTPNVAITAIDAPTETNPSAMAALNVHLEALGVGDMTTTVQVLDGDGTVGSASYAWPELKAAETAIASLRVEWVPLAGGIRNLRVVASAHPKEVTLLDNEAQTFVSVVSRRFNVLVYEPQPSWVGTFVRRALESDDRFHVMVRARLGPGQTIASAPLPFTAEALEDQNIATVVVAAPQLLVRSEVDALERLVRRRGASVVLLLDGPPTGEIARLLRVTGVERREAPPVVLGTIRTSEFVALRMQGVGATVLAAAGDDPVIVAVPLGQGRIVVSGALDAWRYRADGAFDRFWKSVIADATEATGESLAVTLSPPVASVGEPVTVDAEWRSVRAVPDALDAAAVVECGTQRTLVRLWPSGSRSRFRGAFDAPAAGQCTLKVNISPLANATVSFREFEVPRGPFSQEATLAAAIRAHGGTMVAAGGEAELITRLRALASPQRTSTPIHLMQSPWWIIPFAACLAIEWWLRRRKGLP